MLKCSQIPVLDERAFVRKKPSESPFHRVERRLRLDLELTVVDKVEESLCGRQDFRRDVYSEHPVQDVLNLFRLCANPLSDMGDVLTEMAQPMGS